MPISLSVDWVYAGIILGIPPLLQLITLLIVVAWANKAIIKDDGPLTTARLLHSLIEKLGPGGSLLDNEEIIEAIGNPRVAYNFGASRATGSMDVGIVEKAPRSTLTIEKRFEEGVYD